MGSSASLSAPASPSRQNKIENAVMCADQILIKSARLKAAPQENSPKNGKGASVFLNVRYFIAPSAMSQTSL